MKVYRSFFIGVGKIRLIRLMGMLFFVGEAGGGHFFSDATFFKKGYLFCFY